ncbi:hypothetical protein CPB84DRAFT_1824362 [Gymnopilus junonius]|uniref:Uncharacterized protein n=1 Tax=Gymnopilus junonius TaxID=109634 RepID=A0A9P5NRJ2_GYMJU|nr:hypothetical protein CPB84DRAFT_1824362 [Gymnopilus junonius]
MHITAIQAFPTSVLRHNAFVVALVKMIEKSEKGLRRLDHQTSHNRHLKKDRETMRNQIEALKLRKVELEGENAALKSRLDGQESCIAEAIAQCQGSAEALAKIVRGSSQETKKMTTKKRSLVPDDHIALLYESLPPNRKKRRSMSPAIDMTKPHRLNTSPKTQTQSTSGHRSPIILHPTSSPDLTSSESG